MGDEGALNRIVGETRRAKHGKVWHVRNTHDPSPGGLNHRQEQELFVRARSAALFSGLTLFRNVG